MLSLELLLKVISPGFRPRILGLELNIAIRISHDLVKQSALLTFDDLSHALYQHSILLLNLLILLLKE